MSGPSAMPAFALAKIQPPRPRSALVGRPALEDALARALQQATLTLLLAPAGYGKTAALTQAIRRLPEGCALAWISADEDDPLQRFLACLSAALEPFDLPWRVAPEALGTLAQGERGLSEVSGELLNALAAARVPRGLIVIDDLHRISDPQVFELLHKMLDRWPERWGLVLASRSEPPLPLARLRAAGELAEFGQRQLRFSPAEVDALQALNGVAADAALTRSLLQRTHGWAAGLRLSLAAGTAPAQRRGADLTQRHLFDYLASEVLQHMPAPLQRFLLDCSVLPELSAERCMQLTGDAAAARLLDDVERRGLFVSVLDTEPLTLRLHDLFRDFLEDRLRRLHADAVPALLRRAAAHESDLSRAVAFLVRAGAWDEAVQALAQRGPELLAGGGGPLLQQLLAMFPPAQFDAQAELQLLRGLLAFSRYDWDTLYDAMQRAADGYAAAGRQRDAAVARAYASAGMHHVGRRDEASAMLQSLRALPLDDAAHAVICYISAWDAFAGERSEQVVAMVGEMLDCLERIPDVRLWLQCANLSLLVGLPGMGVLLERFAAGVMRVAGPAPSQLRAAVMHVRAGQAIGAGRLDEAWEWLQRADEDCQWLGRPRLLMTDNALTHVLLHALRGEAEACLRHGQQAHQDMQQHGAPSHRRVHLSDVLAARMRAAWLLGDEAALRRVDTLLNEAAHPWEWASAARCRAWSRACIALLDGRLDEARTLLEPMAHDIERYRYYAGAQARFMLADIHVRQGALDAAAALLQPWLRQVAQGADVGGALFAGAPLLQRLAEADWGARLTPEERGQLRMLRGLLGKGAVAAASLPASPDAPPPEGAGLDGLSEREREVLARIAAGDSNKLIARAFSLSPHTVKRHVANILDKLGVQTRGQAAARWRVPD
ncbi:MAG TPA: LuxR C-terminal-related transcriptional regulator [Rubrivivax sp.]|nr:LuxR C-terminal-related transcriptional regulator [Rubrivivax sp.]